MWTLVNLVFVILLVSIFDIKHRYVPPVMMCLIYVNTALVAWWIGAGVSLTGSLAGLLVLVALPAGDAVGMAICGLLVGPAIIMAAEATAFLGLLAFLTCYGERISLVQHPFFPYLGAVVLIYAWILPMYFPNHFPIIFPLIFR